MAKGFKKPAAEGVCYIAMLGDEAKKLTFINLKSLLLNE